MLTFQDQYEIAQKGAHDSSDEALTFLKQGINVGLHLVEDALGSFYTEKTRIIDTVADQDTYYTPDNYIRMKHIYTIVSGERKPILIEVRDEEQWQRIKSASATSTYPTHVIYRENSFEVYPTPNASGTDMVCRYEATSIDMSYANYTTGNVTTLANAGVTVTGGSTPAWDDTLIGRYFKIDEYPRWYEILDAPTSTTLTLAKPYQGLAISGGTEAYTIGEIPHIPEPTHILPVYHALWQYFMLYKVDIVKMNQYQDMFFGNGKYKESGLEGAKARWGRRSTSKVIPGQRRLRRGLRNISPNIPPPALP